MHSEGQTGHGSEREPEPELYPNHRVKLLISRSKHYWSRSRISHGNGDGVSSFLHHCNQQTWLNIFPSGQWIQLSQIWPTSSCIPIFNWHSFLSRILFKIHILGGKLWRADGAFLEQGRHVPEPGQPISVEHQSPSDGGLPLGNRPETAHQLLRVLHQTHLHWKVRSDDSGTVWLRLTPRTNTRMPLVSAKFSFVASFGAIRRKSICFFGSSAFSLMRPKTQNICFWPIHTIHELAILGGISERRKNTIDSFLFLNSSFLLSPVFLIHQTCTDFPNHWFISLSTPLCTILYLFTKKSRLSIFTPISCLFSRRYVCWREGRPLRDCREPGFMWHSCLTFVHRKFRAVLHADDAVVRQPGCDVQRLQSASSALSGSIPRWRILPGPSRLPQSSPHERGRWETSPCPCFSGRELQQAERPVWFTLSSLSRATQDHPIPLRKALCRTYRFRLLYVEIRLKMNSQFLLFTSL